MSWKDRIILALQIAGSVAKELGVPGAGIASSLVEIARAANAAHVEVTGKPIDLEKLHEV